MKYRARCSHCEARRTLAKHPDDYTRPPACRYCGGKKWRVDKYRHRMELGRGCTCQGYWFPHRKGSGYCQHGGPMALPVPVPVPVDYDILEAFEDAL